MQPKTLIRPLLASLIVASLSACGAVESDPHRFENLAERIAAISLDGSARAEPARIRTAAEIGLRPAQPGALRVEIMDPHELWDAREGNLSAAIDQAVPRLVQAAAPAVATAVVHQVSTRTLASASEAGLRPALKVAPATRASTLIQLGAYSSDAAARSAWSRLSTGEGAVALAGLSPVFEGVEVNGRTLIRLKVAAPAGAAAAVCAAARINDPWCRRNA
ncbi:SPOR domain-containing protein [uncultured Brevundimonas sp.]|uniref:SPOR domain-containing protein n=1 Tax=uncultured Brevundimonas sp. TaxID=213418 RepID=UPI0030EB880B|tara:strand:- start:411 stop:1070 length:660 start_codon:yes stop_codon:yes gene_type:complete